MNRIRLGVAVFVVGSLVGCDAIDDLRSKSDDAEAPPDESPKPASAEKEPAPQPAKSEPAPAGTSAAEPVAEAEPAPEEPPAAEPRPPGLRRMVSDSCAIRGNKLWCWESRGEGGKQIAGVEDPASVTSSCALLKSKTVKCVAEGKATPVPGLEGVTAVASAPYGKLCAVLESGKVRCQRRDGSKAEDVEGVDDAIDVAVTGRHGCAILRGGKVSCWGNNEHGQLGSSPTLFGSNKKQSAREVAGVENVVEISVGGDHSCARTEAGEVYCWGSNESGRSTGSGSEESVLPTKVVEGAVSMSAGLQSCAVTFGELTCWGEELAQPLTMPTDGEVLAVTIGRDGCVMLEDERVQCWGEPMNFNPDDAGVWRKKIPGAKTATLGVLGPIVLTDSGKLEFFDPGWLEALPELAKLEDIAEVDVEGRTLCVIDQAGKLQCWTRAGGIEPAATWAGDAEAPPLEALTVWRDRGCAITNKGKLACFTPTKPPKVTELGNAVGKLVDIAAVGHRCALEAKGKLRCFGPNGEGELGQGHVKETTKQVSPKKVRGVVEVDTDLNYTCARTKKGAVFCWGGEFMEGNEPLAPRDVGVEAAAQIAVGYNMACARDEAGLVQCWRDWVDYDADPPETKAEEPATPKGFEGEAKDIRMTDNRLCAVYADGEVRCGILGPMAHKSGEIPIEVPMG